MADKRKTALIISSYDNNPATKRKILLFLKHAGGLRDLGTVLIDRNTRQIRKYCKEAEIPVIRTDFRGDFLNGQNFESLTIIGACEADDCSLRIKPYLEAPGRGYVVTSRYLSWDGPLDINYT